MYMKETDKITRKRLIHVKRLHMHAQQHILHGTEFGKMLAIHHFDNAVELLLKCMATEYEISLGDPLHLTFHKLWKEVGKEYKQRLGSELPNKTEIFHLHRIRGDVQHLGISPFSLEFIKDSDKCTYDFVVTVLNSVFGLKYNELFLSSLVNDTKLRELLTDAERYYAEENWKEAIAKVSVSFALAKRKAQRERHLPTFPTLSRIRLGSEDADERVDILALGLDIEEYKKFIKNTPVVFIMDYEKPTFHFQYTRELDYTKENILFCFNFALNSILRWNL